MRAHFPAALMRMTGFGPVVDNGYSHNVLDLTYEGAHWLNNNIKQASNRDVDGKRRGVEWM